MIGIGNFKAADCAGVGRRSFLKTAAAIPFTLGSTSQVMEAAQAAQKSGKVKSVILLWLWGGPSHIDTLIQSQMHHGISGAFWDNPNQNPGMHFTELMPLMASRGDKYTMIRSMVTTSNDHPTAGTIALTGFNKMPDLFSPISVRSFLKIRLRPRRCLPFMSGEFHEIFRVESKVMAVARWAKLMILFW